jgi:hypothetical protein
MQKTGTAPAPPLTRPVSGALKRDSTSACSMQPQGYCVVAYALVSMAIALYGCGAW